LTERLPFLAPGGTLFLLGKSDILLTTLDGRESTLPLEDLAAFLRHLWTLRPAPPEEGPASRPPFKVFSGG